VRSDLESTWYHDSMAVNSSLNFASDVATAISARVLPYSWRDLLNSSVETLGVSDLITGTSGRISEGLIAAAMFSLDVTRELPAVED